MGHVSCRWLLVLPMLAALLLAGCGSPQRNGTPESRRTGTLIEPAQAERVGYAVNWIAALDVPARQRITSAVILDDLIVTTERPANMVTAISLADGRIRWRQVPDRSLDPLYRPTRQGDRLYINSASQLFTLDARTGDMITAVDLPTAVDTSHTLVNGLAIFGAVNGRVFAMDLDTGQIRWTRQLTGRVAAAPADADNAAIVADDTGRYAKYHAREGTQLWQGRAFAQITGTPAVGENTVYIPSHDQALYALDLETGRDRWTYRDPNPLTIGPILIHDTLFQPLPQQNRLIALDAETGSRKWEFQANALPFSSPRSDRFMLATPTRLRVVRADTGEVLAEAESQPLVTVLPAPNHSLILVDPDGRLIRLNPRR